MAASLTLYRQFVESIGDGTIDLDSHTIQCSLHGSTYTPSADHSLLTQVDSEISGSGYARKFLGNKTYVQTAGSAKWDADDVIYTASGGSISARYAVLSDENVANGALIGYVTLDSSNVTISDGQTLTLQWSTAGIVSVALA